MSFRVPVATYRLQFHAGFRFHDAQRIVPYLSSLGMTDVYASPILRARTGSPHGYDVVDAMELNPELGNEDELTELQGQLDARDMGLVLDIVPNHMAASHENAWWMSVLENGPQSRFAHFFDIDWRTDSGRQRILLPILGRPYGEALASCEIRLDIDEGGFFLSYFDHRLPVAAHSYATILRHCLHELPGEGSTVEIRDLVENEEVVTNPKFIKETLWRVHQGSPELQSALRTVIDSYNGSDDEALDRMDALLDAQWYRLAYWRIASETINYRRFFDVTELVGLRVENPEVFEMRNRRIFDLITDGKVTGLRIDHIDGLYEPANYLSRLQRRLGESGDELPFYVVVEKILAPDEVLPREFRCSGTTGYDFLATVNSVLVDRDGLAKLTEFHRTLGAVTEPFDELVYSRKKQVIEELFFGEIRGLGRTLLQLAVCDRNARDFAPSEILSALIEITACLPVYRTYVNEPPARGSDRHFIRTAIAEARRRAHGVDSRLFDFLQLVLLVEPPHYIAAERDRWLEFVKRWQQFTGRVTAKGVEDTAFYVDNRLISLNEVGADPGGVTEADPLRVFHDRNARIAGEWPDTMNATSTHDTKRSEDFRARVNVISELPDAWAKAVRRWMRLNAAFRKNGVPHASEEMLIYQTLAGMWPLDDESSAGVADRLAAFVQKAAREAKTHSSWLAPDARYESALMDFARSIVSHQPFLAAFRPMQKRLAFHGFLNSLTQTVLKICSPGVPDFYQGSELWDFSLVDPDNRRPVDYERRVAAMKTLPSPRAALRSWRNGQVKLFVTTRSLEVRAGRIESFRGSYHEVKSPTECAVAFLRGDDVLVVVPRLTTRLAQAPRLPLGEVWGDFALSVEGSWRNAFTGEMIAAEALPLRDVFATFPVAILERM